MLTDNFIEFYQTSFRNNWELDALTDYFKEETFTYGQLASQIAKLHILFDEYGVKKGDKIAIIGRNNPRWCIAFMATVTYGAVIVPILQDFNSNDVHHIINHSDAVLLFSGDQYWDIIDAERVINIRAIFSLTDFSRFFHRDSEQPLSMDRVEYLFAEKYPHGFTRKDIVYDHLPNERMVVLNYTSGTTGFSKGVMLSGNNLAGNLVFGRKIHMHYPGTRALSFLPLAHAYGCTFDFLYPLAMGGHVTLLGKIPTPKILIEAMAQVRPNIIFCVPMIIEKIYKKQISPLLEQGLTRWALQLPLLDAGIYALIRKKLIDAFGGNFYEIIVGGAGMNSEVEDFLKKIKFPFTVGYGMTECAPLISYSDKNEFRSLSCGQVLQGLMEVKVESEDPQHIAGEICVRGENVMMGYYKNPEATANVLSEDGWLHTGDIGTVDPDGTIYIRGRSKSMILGTNGQNIYPEEIESKLNNMPCVMESLVIEREGKLIALVYPDYDQADKEGVGRHSALQTLMKTNLTELNKLVAPYERVAEIHLFPNEFEKTPKKSIKRYLYNV